MQKVETKTRFVIFAASRSGSTAFARALDSHDDVFCYQHPFYPHLQNFQRFKNLPKHKVDIETREERPLEYIRDLLAHNRRRPCLGFKIWPLHDVPAVEPVIAALAADTDIKKIHLHRDNQLACFSSRLLVREKRQNPERFDDEQNAPKLAFLKPMFMAYMARRQQWFDQREAISKGDILHVPYEGMMGEGLQRTAAFLDLSEPHTFQSPSKKRNSNDILGRFFPEEHGAVMQVLRDLGKEHWVKESA